MCRILGFSIIGIRKLVVKLLFSGQMIAQPTVGEATDARHASFFEWLVEWRNVGNFYEFAGPYPILQGVTAREAGSLPYRGLGNKRDPYRPNVPGEKTLDFL